VGLAQNLTWHSLVAVAQTTSAAAGSAPLLPVFSRWRFSQTQCSAAEFDFDQRTLDGRSGAALV
jgi:hypothetical protein